MINSNNMYHVNQTIADFGACLLYPSAICFMDGLFKGLPQLLNTRSYDFFNTHQYM